MGSVSPYSLCLHVVILIRLLKLFWGNVKCKFGLYWVVCEGYYFWVVGGILNLWIQQLSVSDTTETFFGCASQWV